MTIVRRSSWSGVGLAAVLVQLVLLAPPAAAAPDPVTCTGYPEPRVFLESQSWWRGTPAGNTTVRHVHAGACFPYRQVLDGQVRIDVVTKLHDYRGWMLRHVRVYAASDDDGAEQLGSTSPRTTCNSVDCTFVTPMTVDLSELPSGTWEFRIHSEARPDATAGEPWNLATGGWLACVRTCSGREPQAVNAWETEGRGYYENAAESVKGYVNGRLLDPLPWDHTTGSLEPKSGTWCPNVRTLKGAGDEPVTSSFITLDPSFHDIPEDRGRILLEQPGSFEGPVCIDTAALSDGVHKLFVQASWDGGSERLWGAIVIPFLVRNGTKVGAPWHVADRVAPSLRARVRPRQRVARRRGVVAKVRCSERCEVGMLARLVIGGRSYRMRNASRAAPPARSVRIRARLTGRSARALRRALRNGRRARVRVKLRAYDQAGNGSPSIRRVVRVRR